MLLANFNGKEHLRHRAVSLRQHGFLVMHVFTVFYKSEKHVFMFFICKLMF